MARCMWLYVAVCVVDEREVAQMVTICLSPWTLLNLAGKIVSSDGGRRDDSELQWRVYWKISTRYDGRGICE